MSIHDIVVNVIIGLMTGGISGIIVTVWFRHIDKEREKDRYFGSLYQYINSLIKPLSNVDEESSLNELYMIVTNPIPRALYLWFSKKEKEILHNFDEIYHTLLLSTVEAYVWTENKKNKVYYARKKDFIDNNINENIDKLKTITSEKLLRMARCILEDRR